MNLKKQYWGMLLPAAILFLALEPARQFNLITPGQFVIPGILQSVVFVLSAVTAIAGPLFCRSLFAHAMRKKKQVPAQAFLLFQRQILWISQITPYLAFIAVFCDFPKFYAAAMVLMALYAIYYYFPSQQRIEFDEKIFRVIQ